MAARKRGEPDLAKAFGVVHPDIEEATRVASHQLTELGVRHVLVGGLGVSSYIADPRATADVDFLVGKEGWPTTGKIVVAVEGMPRQVGRVRIDTMLAPREAPKLDEALDRPLESEGIPVAAPEVLVAMKLIADRPRDRADIDALLEVVDVEVAKAYVAEYAPDYVEHLDDALKEHKRVQNLARKLSR